MANLITKDDFDGLYFIDTSNSGSITKLDKIIEQIEAKLLPQLTYDLDVELEESEIKAMLVCFTFALYNSKQKSINTGVGNVSLDIKGGVTVLSLDEEYAAYNDGVDLFNKYVTDVENEMIYQNKYGI